MKRSREKPGFSVGICGPPGSGKTAIGCTAPGQLWIQTESNGLGTIHEWAEEVGEVENLADLLVETPSEIPVVIPIFPGKHKQESRDLQSMLKSLDEAVLFIRNNAAEIKRMGRKTVILDSLTDVNQRVIDLEGNDAGDQIPMASWQRIKVRTLRVVEALRSVVSSGLDLIIIFGLQENHKPDPSNKMERIFAGWTPLISGAARETFMYKLMAVGSVSVVMKTTRAGKVVERTTRFQGRTGYHVFKTKGALSDSEGVDFNEWKRRALMRPEG